MSGSDEDTKMINKLRKDQNRGSMVRIVETMLENAFQHAWKKKQISKADKLKVIQKQQSK